VKPRRGAARRPRERRFCALSYPPLSPIFLTPRLARQPGTRRTRRVISAQVLPRRAVGRGSTPARPPRSSGSRAANDCRPPCRPAFARWHLMPTAWPADSRRPRRRPQCRPRLLAEALPGPVCSQAPTLSRGAPHLVTQPSSPGGRPVTPAARRSSAAAAGRTAACTARIIFLAGHSYITVRSRIQRITQHGAYELRRRTAFQVSARKF